MGTTRSTSLAGASVLVVGAGRSGVAAARLALSEGARVILSDSRQRLDAMATIKDTFSNVGSALTLEFGGHREQSFIAANLIVLSPGVPQIPEIGAAERAGVPLISELEFASRFIQAPIIAITGTNGKSTTTSLVAQMLSASGRPYFCGGNLGVPLCESIGSRAAGPDGIVLVEVSSFQLERVVTFRAHIAALLNLSSDHLDRYPNYEAYQRTKARIFERQKIDDYAVVRNLDEDAPAYFALQQQEAQRLTFGARRGAESGAFLEGSGNVLCIQTPGAKIDRFPRSALNLPGRHNTSNALAALLIARLAGVSPVSCERGLREFRALPHRMALVDDIAGVHYYNDSKATNVGAVVASLNGFDRRVVLIAGGRDKGGSFRPLDTLWGDPCFHLIAIGEAGDNLIETAKGRVPSSRAKTLAAAVEMASEIASAGDAVVLSPACSSYDMFGDYEERGRAFIDAVHRLSQRTA